MAREGVGAGRRFQVDIEAAIELGRRTSVDAPCAGAVGFECDLAMPRRGPALDVSSPGDPVAVERDRVVHGPRTAVFDSRAVPLEPVARTVREEEHRLEAVTCVEVPPRS